MVTNNCDVYTAKKALDYNYSAEQTKAYFDLVQQGLDSDSAKYVMDGYDIETAKSLAGRDAYTHNEEMSQRTLRNASNLDKLTQSQEGILTKYFIESGYDKLSTPVQNDTTVYRIVRTGGDSDYEINWKIGDVFTEKGFTSTSPEGNKTFAKKSEGLARRDHAQLVNLEINVPAGTKVVNMQNAYDEILLKNGSTFKVTNYDAETKTYTLDLIPAATSKLSNTSSSNLFIATGGRDETVSDFCNAIISGNTAIIYNNSDLDVDAWGEAKSKVENGSKYLTEQIEAFRAGKELPYPECGGLTKEFLETYGESLYENVLVVNSSNENAAEAAALFASGEPTKIIKAKGLAKDRLTAFDNDKVIDERYRTAIAGSLDPKSLTDEQIETILKPFVEKLINAPQERKLIIITGRAAAGKSTIVDKLENLNENYFIPDADVIKEQLPGYKENGTGYVHNASVALNRQLVDAALEGGTNLVMQTTGWHSYVQEVITYAKNQGYDVQLIHSNVDPDKSAIRSIKRFESTGRYVEPYLILHSDYVNDIVPTFKNNPDLSKVTVYDNNGAAPVKVDE